MSFIKGLVILSTAIVLSSCSSFSAKNPTADVDQDKKEKQAVNKKFPKSYYDRIAPRACTSAALHIIFSATLRKWPQF